MQQPSSHSRQHCVLRGQHKARALNAGVNAPACSSTILAPPHPQTQNRPRVHEPSPRRHPGPHGDAASTMQHHSIGPPRSLSKPGVPHWPGFSIVPSQEGDCACRPPRSTSTYYVHAHTYILLHPILRLLLLGFKHNLLHLHLVKQVVAFHRLAQRHNLIRHEPVCVS